MAELQQRDSLTGLYNRSYFLECVDRHIKACKEGKQFFILFTDIDNFKTINNSLGYDIGDKLLVKLSERLLPLMGDRDILSRYSGDEFAILCKSCNDENVLDIARIILKEIEKPFTVENTSLNITAEIGISRFPKDGREAPTLVRNAETVIYQPKDQFYNRISFYSREVSQQINEKFNLINLLATAIASGEMSLHYQPIFEINNFKTIVGLEALLRWENPELGMVSPGKFIPVAEETGHIINIGEWVLKEVARQINVWKEKNYKILPVAINVSVKQLEQRNFGQRFIEIMKAYTIDWQYIELEITESVSSGDLSTILRNLQDLKKCGVKISMDDFGAGFSSLGQIDLFELDKLKIDKAFIDNLFDINKKQNLVETIIAMGKSLNLTVIAEGIETKEQLSYLKDIGCQLGQGYILSKPLPAEEIEVLFN